MNLQGDEPVFDPHMVERMVERLQRDPGVDIVTACHQIHSVKEFQSPHVVKVVLDRRGNAMYFSRSPIPEGGLATGTAYRHVGVYAFRREALARFAQPAALAAGNRRTPGAAARAGKRHDDRRGGDKARHGGCRRARGHKNC